jgi:hypothetical protein
MVYFEISRSLGYGTLVSHEVVTLHDGEQVAIDNDTAIQSLTPAEYLDFIEMHGSTVAT